MTTRVSCVSEPKTLFVVDALTLGNDLTQIEIITTTIERTEVFLRKNEHLEQRIIERFIRQRASKGYKVTKC